MSDDTNNNSDQAYADTLWKAAESRKLEKAIRQNLAGLGFWEDRP